jgi:hypothetical protein
MVRSNGGEAGRVLTCARNLEASPLCIELIDRAKSSEWWCAVHIVQSRSARKMAVYCVEQDDEAAGTTCFERGEEVG